MWQCCWISENKQSSGLQTTKQFSEGIYSSSPAKKVWYHRCTEKPREELNPQYGMWFELEGHYLSFFCLMQKSNSYMKLVPLKMTFINKMWTFMTIITWNTPCFCVLVWKQYTGVIKMNTLIDIRITIRIRKPLFVGLIIKFIDN